MSGPGRLTLWATGGLLIVVALGVVLMLQALDRKLGPPCLDRVAPAPAGRLVADLERGHGRLAITYDDGLELEVPLRPRRIVSALPGITEMLCHLGAEAQLVAVSPRSDQPPSIAHLPHISVLPFDVEAVLAQRADLLVVDRRLHRRDLAVMRSRVRHVLLLDTSRSLPDLLASMDLLAAVLDTPEAKSGAAAFRARAEALTRALETARPAPPPRVLIVAQWDPLYVLGHGSLLDDLVRLCGGVNVACDLQSDASGTFSEELVLARRPEMILWMAGPLPARLRERWQHVPAVAEGRLIDASADDLQRAGPRILDGLERLAASMHEAR